MIPITRNHADNSEADPRRDILIIAADQYKRATAGPAGTAPYNPTIRSPGGAAQKQSREHAGYKPTARM